MSFSGLGEIIIIQIFLKELQTVFMGNVALVESGHVLGAGTHEPHLSVYESPGISYLRILLDTLFFRDSLSFLNIILCSSSK